MNSGKKRAGLSEMDVNEQTDLLKSILESSTENSIIALDLKGMILAWNAGAALTTAILSRSFWKKLIYIAKHLIRSEITRSKHGG